MTLAPARNDLFQLNLPILRVLIFGSNIWGFLLTESAFLENPLNLDNNDHNKVVTTIDEHFFLAHVLLLTMDPTL